MQASTRPRCPFYACHNSRPPTLELSWRSSPRCPCRHSSNSPSDSSNASRTWVQVPTKFRGNVQIVPGTWPDNAGKRVGGSCFRGLLDFAKTTGVGVPSSDLSHIRGDFLGNATKQTEKAICGHIRGTTIVKYRRRLSPSRSSLTGRKGHCLFACAEESKWARGLACDSNTCAEDRKEPQRGARSASSTPETRGACLRNSPHAALPIKCRRLPVSLNGSCFTGEKSACDAIGHWFALLMIQFWGKIVNTILGDLLVVN